MGEQLKARSAATGNKNKFLMDLVREWDPNRDGTISKVRLPACCYPSATCFHLPYPHFAFHSTSVHFPHTRSPRWSFGRT